MRKALLVVDVQNDFCPGGALAVSGGDEVVLQINRLIKYADKDSKDWKNWVIVLTRDWHPSNSRHFEKWPPHCVAGTPGADFHPDLFKRDFQYLLSKGTKPEEDGYSPWENGKVDIGLCIGNSFRLAPNVVPTTLEDLLRSAGVEDVYICGLATDYCVKAAASGAIERGFRVFLVLDACRAVNEEAGAAAVKELRSLGVIVTSTEEILKG